MWTLLQVILWALVALPFLLVALALVGATCGHFSLQKSIKAAANHPCPRCGELIGREAVLAAIDRKAQEVSNIMKQYLRPRVRPVWSIVCPHCGAALLFHLNENRLEGPSETADPTARGPAS
jgi:predicted RNA-binding Zn-ribbon protein involved in translation (DUF1610 family)